MLCSKKMRLLAFLFLVGVCVFQLSVSVPVVRGLVIIPLAISFYISSQLKPLKSFGFGFLYGFLLFSPQLYWFYILFDFFALFLWSLLGLWTALWFYSISVAYSIKSLSLNHRILLGCFLSSILWIGMEFLRSEYLYLRFSWFTTGYIIGPHPLSSIVGVYGWSFLLMFVAAISVKFKPKILIPVITVLGVCLLGPWMASSIVGHPKMESPLVVGIQYEFEEEIVIRNRLDSIVSQIPEVDLIVLSEYAFNQPPEWMPAWCKTYGKHVIAGTTTLAEDGVNFYNTAVVWGPSGKIVFTQSKSKPVQFVETCLPSKKQSLWESPWGKIGIGICFDSSYRKIMDSLISQGAELIIVPAMDIEEWGLYAHELDARVCPIRAAEYGVPFIRVCSSGISQSIQAGGLEVSTVPMPGQGELLNAKLNMKSGSVPLDIYLAFPSALLFIVTVFYGICRFLVSAFCSKKTNIHQ
jgi:apolipoprotein N-acyltransferase